MIPKRRHPPPLLLTPGNTKLGDSLIWGFTLPSRRTCPGRTATCSLACYSAHLEALRPSLAAAARRNLAATRRENFAQLVMATITVFEIRVVRVHIGGDFYSPTYARKWLVVMCRMPDTIFYFYTRSWRVPAIRRVLVRMARLPNVQSWWSCDRDTGLPRRRPLRVRLAWLMTRADDLPPVGADLVFRTQPLRRQPAKTVNGALVCPVENGTTGHATDCARCGVCWRPAEQPEQRPTLLPLPVLP